MVRPGEERTYGNVIDDEHDGISHSENVKPNDDGVAELDTDLDKVSIDPSSRDDGETIVSGDGSYAIEKNQKSNRKKTTEERTLSKDAGEDETDDTSNTVTSVDIHGVVEVEVAFEGREDVGEDRGDDTDEEGGGSSDVSSCRIESESAKQGGRRRQKRRTSGSNGDETDNGTGAEADGGPLALETVVHEHPGDGGGGSSEVGVDDGEGGFEVRGEGTSPVESEPADPEEDGTEEDVGDVVRLEGESFRPESSSLAEIDRVDQSSDSGDDFDGSSSSVVEDTVLEGVSRRGPDGTSDGAVDEGRPDEHEEDGGTDATSFGGGSDGDGGDEGGEHVLVDGVDDLGNFVVGSWDGLLERVAEGEVVEIAEEGSSRLGEGEGVSPEEPL